MITEILITDRQESINYNRHFFNPACQFSTTVNCVCPVCSTGARKRKSLAAYGIIRMVKSGRRCAGKRSLGVPAWKNADTLSIGHRPYAYRSCLGDNDGKVLFVAPSVQTTDVATTICVDLDGTLVHSDTLHENVLLLLRTSPLSLVSALVTLSRGIAAFKRAVSSRVAIRPDLLPYNEELVAYLAEQAARGRRILLVTAADRLVADGVAEHLGIFEGVLASDGSTNLKAEAKISQIRQYLNGELFEYAGDSLSDIPVWKAASAAILVNPTASIRLAVRNAGVPITKEFRGRGKFGAFIRAMRIYQWSKNLLIFAPLFLSHTILHAHKLVVTAEAFVAFSAAASAIYVINDLLDLESDRQHLRKRHRPFAAGTISIMEGMTLAVMLLIISLGISVRMPPQAGLLMVLYLLASLAYSVFVKTQVFLDVIILAGLYTVRLLFGGVVAGIVISAWTLAFSIFFFTSLATCKRLSELRGSGVQNKGPLPGRAYSQTDLLSLTALATSSGYVAVLILALYLNSPEVVVLYRHPKVLWFLVPVLMYWISRTIMIANRGEMHDDPIVFAFGDRSSQVVGLAALAVVAGAI